MIAFTAEELKLLGSLGADLGINTSYRLARTKLRQMEAQLEAQAQALITGTIPEYKKRLTSPAPGDKINYRPYLIKAEEKLSAIRALQTRISNEL